jgi:hypothetical protein
MNERIEGQGRLETIESPKKVWQVNYRFDITTHVMRKSGFPPVATQRDSRGTIQSLDEKPIPEGSCQLHTDDEILRVKNVGLGTWVIFGSLKCAGPRGRKKPVPNFPE